MKTKGCITINGQEIKTTLIVSYKSGLKTEDFKEAKKGLKFKEERKLKFTGRDVLFFDTEEEATKAKEKLEKRGNVEAVMFDAECKVTKASVTNDLFADNWNFHMKPNPNIPNDNFNWLKLKQINDNQGPKPVALLAVLDGGTNPDHPDLVGKLVEGFNSYENKTASQGGTIRIAGETHGTLVAGMAVAKTNNGIHGNSIGGIFDNVKVLPITVDNPATKNPTSSSMETAINYAISQGAVAINVSMYGSLLLFNRYVFVPAYDADIAIFAAAGNDANDNSVTSVFPAVNPNVYAVSNVHPDLTLNTSSNYGKIKFAGNGSNVIMLTDTGAMGVTWGGTSSASPHVASIYTAMKAVAPNLTRDEIIQIMTDTAYLKDGNSHYYGVGYPNAVEAIRLARLTDGSFVQDTTAKNVPRNKVWTVTFNNPVDPTRLDGVYVLNAGLNDPKQIGKEHPVTVTASGNTLIVTPNTNYDSKEGYVLVISDVYNTSGIKLASNSLKVFITVT